MTYRDHDVESTGQASAERVELEIARRFLTDEMIAAGITAEMMKAGVEAFCGYDHRFESEYDAVFRVYRAMVERSKCKESRAG